MRDLSAETIKVQELLAKSKRILITMSSPDGDSIGSSLALKLILEQNDKNADIVCSFDLGGRFNQYSGSDSIIVADIGRIDYTIYDAVFTLDAGHLSRLVRPELYPNGFNFPKSIEVVNIDHHASNDNFGTINVNVMDAPCTAQVMNALFQGKYEMDSYMATLMYFSIVYDTGNFRFNVTQDLFDFASTCAKNGANTEEVINDYYNNRSILQTKYEAVLLSRLEQNGNYIFTKAYHADIEKYGMDVGMYLSATATIARDYMSSFKDADFGWVVSERKNDVVKVEMRGKIEETPILEITNSLVGGGHKKACGAKVFNKTLEEVQDYILKYLQ